MTESQLCLGSEGDEDSTNQLAGWLSSLLTEGDVIALSGPLGVGKSFFARAIIRHSLQEPDMIVPSPSFTLVYPYQWVRSGVSREIWHSDLYRLADSQDVHELGFWDGLAQKQITLIVEWPEIIMDELLTSAHAPRLLWLAMDYTDERNDTAPRRITIRHLGESWLARLDSSPIPPIFNPPIFNPIIPPITPSLQSMGDGLTYLPDCAALLAAGKGSRMGPAGLTLPKPLFPLAGKPMIEWAYDRLKAAGVRQFTINLHHLAPLLTNYFAKFGDCELYHEAELLETGGGVKAMIGGLGPCFFVVNCDALWRDKGGGPNGKDLISRMRHEFHRLLANYPLDSGEPTESIESLAIGLMLLIPLENTHGYSGVGDFSVTTGGFVKRWDKTESQNDATRYVFGGVQILTPACFSDTPNGAFSLNLVYDRLIKAGRLYGWVYDGEWYHTGDPESLLLAEQAFRELG